MASRFFFKPFVTVPVAPIITGMIIRFMYHIRFISVHKLLYFSFSSAFFCVTFPSAGIATSLKYACSLFLVFNYYICPICHNFSICVYPLILKHCCIFLVTYQLGCVCTICLSFRCQYFAYRAMQMCPNSVLSHQVLIFRQNGAS